MKAPFPYFGGKRQIAGEVWRSLGRDLGSYNEPFAASAAVLLERPAPWTGVETINDVDGYVANFWRALQAEPDAVADGMNWPVNEVDLEARHKWLVQADRKREHLERMKDDPAYYDVKIAAWWCWGLCAWIGCGWCGGEWHGRGSDANRGRGINVQDDDRGGQRPHLGDAGQGVHRKLPHLGDAGQGECARRGAVLREWMNALADRLRNVRVCCGDWRRVVTDVQAKSFGTVGVFLDPPYSDEAGRTDDIYRCDDLSVAHAVRDWCLTKTGDSAWRIVLAGYEGEHEALETTGWRVHAWKAHGGMANLSNRDDSTGNQNRHRERLWISPSCCCAERGLFG